MDIQSRIGQRLLIAFKGKDRPSAEVLSALQNYTPAGITLFRSLNIDNPQQLRHLILQLQQEAARLHIHPLLIGLDQEGGQLMALGQGTPLPGNMALGAARDSELAYKAGQIIGKEMSALGVNVVYAPCADVNSNPFNPVVGTRSFSDDPEVVSALTAALIKGIQSCGVAATVKHFPGHGDTSTDSHHKLSTLAHSMEHLRSIELPPFKAAIQEDVKMLMTAHLGIQAIDGLDSPPATLSKNVVSGLLRKDLNYHGVVVTDAMDMHAIQQGEALGGEVVKAATSGVDLIMITSNPLDQQRAFSSLEKASNQGHLPSSDMRESLDRIAQLKNWLVENLQFHTLTQIRCPEHMQIAQQIADRSVTLVKNDGILPLKLTSAQRIAVVLPTPQDLTPADTSSFTRPALADALRQYHACVDEIMIHMEPDENEMERVLQQVKGYDFVVIGSLNAYTQFRQKKLFDRILDLQIPTLVVALRLPYDAAIFPQASALLCTYSILEPSMQSAAKVIFGELAPQGILPVKLDAFIQERK